MVSNFKGDILKESSKYKMVSDTFLQKVTDYQEETSLFSIDHK
jgi:hypothetical protein